MSTRDRKAIVIGALVVAAAWLATRGVPGALQWVDRLEGTVDQQARLLRSARARLATLPQLDDSVAMLTGVADSLPAMLLSAGDAEAARVDLMSRVRRILDGRPAGIRGFEPGGAELTSGPLTRVSIVVALETDFRGLVEVAGALEGSHVLAIESVEVEAPDADEEDAVELLTARIVVSGWFREVGLPAARTTEATEVGA